MNRRLLLLNLILLALLAWGGDKLRRRWQEARAHEVQVLANAPTPLQVVQPPSPPKLEPPPATNYIGVAQQTLFSQDRNPNVVIETTPPPPEPPVPPMPAYHGQMGFGEPVVLLSTTSSPQKGYRVGDAIGEFKLLKFDLEKITLGWNGKELERELRALAPKDEPAAKGAAPATVAGTAKGKGKAKARVASTSDTQQPAAAAPNVQSVGAPSNAQTARGKNNPIFGASLGVNRACVPTDTTAAGTVVDGFKKVITPGLMGECYWEPSK